MNRLATLAVTIAGLTAAMTPTSAAGTEDQRNGAACEMGFGTHPSRPSSLWRSILNRALARVRDHHADDLGRAFVHLDRLALLHG
jgi:hypothetical protein